MAIAEAQGVEGVKGLIGQQIGPSEWREVTQEDINTFADLSGDHQWIHVDVERAKEESPFGGTIAHGNLTLSLIDGFRQDLISASGFQLGVNYGWNKIRFPAPVPAGAKVRASAEVVELDEVGGGWWQMVTRFTVEVEGSEKPCCVGRQRRPLPARAAAPTAPRRRPRVTLSAESRAARLLDRQRPFHAAFAVARHRAEVGVFARGQVAQIGLGA